MRIVYFSDTHNEHENLHIPQGDLLIFGGDMSVNGSNDEIMAFLDWFQALPHYYKILIAGNHDISLDYDMIGTRSTRLLKRLSRCCDNVVSFYLENSSCEIEGIKIWGSPITPEYSSKWGFKKKRGSQLREHWSKIPDDTNILLTHGPAFGKNDVWMGENIGDDALTHHIKRVKPKFHLCGHVHEGRGISVDNDTIYLNGAVVDNNDNLQNPAWIIEYETSTIYDNDFCEFIKD